MPDFLTRRNGSWHFVRRVPVEFMEFDRRGVIRHSTKVRVASDRTGRRATRVADQLNEKLERHWQELAAKHVSPSVNGYEEARRRARSLGFDYIENAQLIMLPTERRLERLEALVLKGAAADAGARKAVLGTEKKPPFMLSQLFVEFEAATKDETKDFSPNQLRVWRSERERAVKSFVEVVGDKAVSEVTADDGIDYGEWWRGRVLAGETTAKTANKAIGQLSRMLKEMNIRRRLNLPEIFKGLRLRGAVDRSRSPFESEFIQDELLATGALDELNEDARLVVYVLAETGLRLSEAVNLQRHTIHLDAPIPYIEVLPDGRRLKTEDSRREIPLVGVALAALKMRPDGFARYRDKGSSLSAVVNKFLETRGLRPTKDHTVYSLRHSFKDRLIAAEAPDSLIDSLMGHRTGKPRYGKGPPLELKHKYLDSIAFTPPSRL